MPIDVAWYDDERTIIVATFTDPWEWDDYFNAQHRVNAMIESVDTIVDTIADFSATEQLPSRAISALPKIADITHPRQTLTTVSRTSMMGTIASDMFSRLYRSVNRVDTLEEAIALCRQHQQARQEG